jgi:hypothetical protein
MRNVDWIVIAPTAAYVLSVALVPWVGLGHYGKQAVALNGMLKFARTAENAMVTAATT